MKRFLLSFLSFCLISNSFAQDFPGYRAGNYTGVNGVFFNPATIADSRYGFDVNLFSISSFVGNNKASFQLKNITESFDSDSLKQQFIGKNSGPSTGIINLDVHGPSFMFNAAKGAIALTTRVRTMANLIDIDGELINQISEDVSSDVSFPYTISSTGNMRIAVTSWAEFGASYARVLKNEGAHFIKGGLSLKYLAGAGNGYIGIDKINGTLTQDATFNTYLTNATGRVSAGFGGLNISDMEPGDLKMESTGFGADIGFVYEWRPDGEAYKLASGKEMQDRNKYKLRAGAALLDFGKMKFTKDVQRSGSYDIGITGSERLNLDELEEIDNYNAFFKSKPEFFTPASGDNTADYKVSLPTTLQLDVDYHIHRGFYASLASQFSLLGKNTDVFNNRYYNSVALTPRYEGRKFGFYLPVSYNSLTKFNAGVSLRAGPLFIGSGSILSAAIGSSKQADVHFGLRFGGLKKDVEKKEQKKERKENKRKKRKTTE